MYKKRVYGERICEFCQETFTPLKSNSVNCKDCKKERQRLRSVKSFKKNREVAYKRYNQYALDNPKEICFINAKKRAKQRGTEFLITINDFDWPTHCPILKIELKRKTKYAPSLDRRDNTKGYIPGNVWIISRLANTMKNGATQEEIRKFGEWAKTFQP